MRRIAYFISPHGFGHAARSCAVMEGLLRRRPGIRFELFTEVPRWFFSESLPECFTYHPDLVAASDIVVGKLGYSTVAEAYHPGAAFAYVARPNFPESPILASFVNQHMNAMEIEESAFRCGRWLPQIEPLLAVPRKLPEMANGADNAANAILELFSI